MTLPPLVASVAWLSAAAVVGAEDEPERTWLGWAVGFVPAFVVIGVAYLVVRRIRSKR